MGFPFKLDHPNCHLYFCKVISGSKESLFLYTVLCLKSWIFINRSQKREACKISNRIKRYILLLDCLFWPRLPKVSHAFKIFHSFSTQCTIRKWQYFSPSLLSLQNVLWLYINVTFKALEMFMKIELPKCSLQSIAIGMGAFALKTLDFFFCRLLRKNS